jgi:SAM-dependent methyltransferase
MRSGARHFPDAEAIWVEDLKGRAAHSANVGRMLCNCDYPYHFLWPILRAAGVTGSLRYQEEGALAPVLSPLIYDGTKILIAGSADTGTLCVAGRIAAQRQPKFSLIDRCPAPLKLVDEFTAERGIVCETLCADLTEFGEIARWDVVLINYTLQFIAPAQRPRVFKNLARALVPGGTLICVAKTANRVSEEAAAHLETRWLEKTRSKLRSAALKLPLPAAEFDNLLHQAAASRIIRRLTIPSHSEIIECMLGADLNPTEDHETPRKQVLAIEGARDSDIESSVILAATRAL